MMQDQLDLLDSLRDDGYMVLVFTPDQMRSLDAEDQAFLSNMLITKAHEFFHFADNVKEVYDENR